MPGTDPDVIVGGRLQHGSPAATAQALWSSESIPPNERFACWREFVSHALVPLEIHRRLAGPFAATMHGGALGPLAISRISAEPGCVRRTQALVDRGAGDAIFVNVQLQGPASASQNGRTAHLIPGDFAIVDCARQWEFEFPDHFQAICVAVPPDMLASRLAVPDAATAVRVPGASGLGALIVNQLQFLADAATSLDDEAARHVADQLVELTALALGRSQSSLSSSNRGLLLQAAIDEIERRLSDVELSPAGVAQHVNISTRYLHRLFTDRGTTFGRWLLARRLELCSRDLADPTLLHLTISEVAQRHGFTDRTHFARAFRDRYGLTPSAYRRDRFRAHYYAIALTGRTSSTTGAMA